MSFAQPGRSAEEIEANKFDLKGQGQAWLGTLFLVFPKEVIKDHKGDGTYAPTDVVVADIIFVDGPQQGRFLQDTWIFAKPIVNATKGHLGEPVLGRLGQRQFPKGLGWVLNEYTDADVAQATPVLTQYQQGAFNQPTESPAAPPAASASPWDQAGWNAPATNTVAPQPVSTTAAPTPGGIDPQLAQFLQSKGVNTANLDPQTAAMIAATLK